MISVFANLTLLDANDRFFTPQHGIHNVDEKVEFAAVFIRKALFCALRRGRMTLGYALIVIFVLYLIDKHNRWRQAAMIVGALIALAAAGLG